MLKYNKMIMVIIVVLPAIMFADWQSLDGPPAGRADDLSIGKHGGTYYLYAADKTHRLYRSTNLGAQWDSVYAENTDQPTCVVAAKDDGWIVYIGRQDDNPEQRVMESENWGQNWHPAGGTNPNWITNTHLLCFAMDPNNSSKIYLGCRAGTCAVFKTEDSGATWDEKPLPTSPANPTVNDIAITHEPLRGTWIIAGCSQTLSRGIWLSTNGGDNWHQKLSNVHIFSVEFATQFTGYAGANEGVYKTEDGGMHWALLPNSPQYIKDLKTITTSKVYAATGSGMFMTEDGGANWDAINVGICARRLSTVMVHPQNPQTLFVGGKLSIYKTIDGGGIWKEVIKGFKVSDFESNTFDYVDKKADYNDVSIFLQQTHKNFK